MEKIWLNHYDSRVAPEIDPDRYASIIDILDESVAKYGDKTAYINMGQTISFSELDPVPAIRRVSDEQWL